MRAHIAGRESKSKSRMTKRVHQDWGQKLAPTVAATNETARRHGTQVLKSNNIRLKTLHEIQLVTFCLTHCQLIFLFDFRSIQLKIFVIQKRHASTAGVLQTFISHRRNIQRNKPHRQTANVFNELQFQQALPWYFLLKICKSGKKRFYQLFNQRA